jgi:proteasomal ATPase-associated factor 1
VTAFDVSPDGSQVATGYHDGTVHILPTMVPNLSGFHLQRSKPHLSSVTALVFFPSSRVLLTAGNDFSLSILSAEPISASSTSPPSLLNPVRTLKGHTRAVNDVAIVERGRNVLSAGKDGTLRLWDVSAGQQIRSMPTYGYGPIQAMSVGARPEGSGGAFSPSMDPDADLDADTPMPPAAPEGTTEVGTDGTLAACALGDGTFEVFDVRLGRSVFRSPTRGTTGLSAIAYSSKDGLLATGSTAGVIGLWDIRMLEAPVVQLTRGLPIIDSLAFMDVLSQPEGTEIIHTGLAITSADALPFVASVRPEGPTVVSELVGSDCDRVGHVRVIGSGVWGGESGGVHVWTASDDGIVRRY